MTDQTTAELIAEANKLLAENQWTSGWGVESLAERLADALEAAEKRAEQAEHLAEVRRETIREYGRENEAWSVRAHTAERERDQYAAVVEKMRELPRYRVPDPVMEWRAVDDEDLNQALDSAPQEVLREVKAAAWDGGYGYSLADVKREARNPYRSES